MEDNSKCVMIAREPPICSVAQAWTGSGLPADLRARLLLLEIVTYPEFLGLVGTQGFARHASMQCGQG